MLKSLSSADIRIWKLHSCLSALVYTLMSILYLYSTLWCGLMKRATKKIKSLNILKLLYCAFKCLVNITVISSCWFSLQHHKIQLKELCDQWTVWSVLSFKLVFNKSWYIVQPYQIFKGCFFFGVPTQYGKLSNLISIIFRPGLVWKKEKSI